MTDGLVTINGVIHGKTVKLEHEPGLPDGQQVSVTISLAGTGATVPPGERLRRSFGAWSEDAADLDLYLEWNRQQRGRSRRGHDQ